MIKSDIINLLKKHARGEKLTDEEVLQFGELTLDEGVTPEALYELLLEDEGRSVYEESIWEPVLMNVFSVDKVPFEQRETGIVAPLHRRHFFSRWGWAAAILVLIGAATYLWMRPIPGSNTSQASRKEDIHPGGNKALLRLADGSTILLDSAANGSLAREGNMSIVKLSDGQIIYRSDGETDGNIRMNTMSTPRGGQYNLTLPDGTKVWLNAASSITYPAAFIGKERKVSINGEAYFEVAKDRAKPFRVTVNKMEVEVLGTQFNIQAYNDEPVIKTTLLEGAVKVTKGPAIQHLKPGQQVRLTQNDQLVLVEEADLSYETAWKHKEFNFKYADLKTMMRQLARWYDLEIIYASNVQVDEQFGGMIPMDASLSLVLKVLEKSGVHFHLEGNKLTVLP